MEDKFMNEGCVFKCLNCPTVKIKPREILAHRTKLEGKKVLTTKAIMLSVSPGICPNLPQNPGGVPNCIPRMISGDWSKFSKHTVGGQHMLLASSEFFCRIGRGYIKVDNNAVHKEVNSSYNAFVLSSWGIKEAINNPKPVSSKTASVEGNVNKKENENGWSEEPLKEKEAEESAVLEEIGDLYCPYDSNKLKCQNCEYAKSDAEHMNSAKIPGSNKQPAAILRGNYEKDFHKLEGTRKGYKDRYATVNEEYELFDRINCGNAAHHILSTKDVYKQDKVRFVLKMANFYKYDVNESYNCIILPGLNAYEERHKNEFQVKFGENLDYEKRKFKFLSMRESGRQWHGGGHGKDFENEHNISCYATEVTNLLYKYMKNATKQHCRADKVYYERDKEEFISTIHRVIDIVRDKLISFEKKPQSSLPYFVSADAYNYAFKTLNIRLLVFRRVSEGIEVYKYMIARKNGVTYPDERGRKIFDLNTQLSCKKLVVFCEQIDVAYMDISKGRIKLPFTVSYALEVNMGGLEIRDYLKNNISSIEAEVFDLPSRENIMKTRLDELKG